MEQHRKRKIDERLEHWCTLTQGIRPENQHEHASKFEISLEMRIARWNIHKSHAHTHNANKTCRKRGKVKMPTTPPIQSVSVFSIRAIADT